MDKFNIKKKIKNYAKICLKPLIKYKKNKDKISNEYLYNIDKSISEIKSTKNNNIFLYNPQLINNLEHNFSDLKNISCSELYRAKDIKKIAYAIIKANTPQVIFSSLYPGWEKLAKQLKIMKPTIKIKIIIYESADKDKSSEIIKINNLLSYMYNYRLINAVGIMQRNQLDFYKSLGIKAVLLNDIIPIKECKLPSKRKTIGIYILDKNNWYENLFTIISATSLIPNITADIYPLDKEIRDVAKELKLKVTGENKRLEGDNLKKKLATNLLNIYVPYLNYNRKLPIQSFAEGVPCIMGKSVSYFKKSPIAEYVYVKNENNPEEIAEKIALCMKHRKTLMNKYQKWNEKKIIENEKALRKFLKI